MTNSQVYPNFAILWPADAATQTPTTSGRRSVAIGQVTVDFAEGTVYREPRASPAQETLLTSLRSLGQGYIRSILIETDQDVTVQFDGGAKYFISGGEISRVTYTQIQRVIIQTNQTTLLRVWGSTHPAGVPEKFSSSIVGGKVTTTAGSSVGRPFARVTRGSALAATYQNIATFTVPGVGTKVTIKEISLGASTIGSVRWKLIIGGEQQFRGLVLPANYAIPFHDNTLNAGTVVRVQAQTIAGTYVTVAGISGVKF